MSGAARIAVVLAVAATATIVANVVLLGVATGRQDPVGRLSPPAAMAAPAPPRVSQPPWPATVLHGHERDHSDD